MLWTKFFIWIKVKIQINLTIYLYSPIFFCWTAETHILGDRQTHKFTYCMPTSREAAFRKASGDGLIDPLAKMGDIPPTSISIKPLRLEAFQDLLLFLFRGEPRKIHRQLMVSGRKALLEYIKSTYWRRESLPCELGCFCFKLSVSEKDGRDHVWRLGKKLDRKEIKRRFTGQMIDCYKSSFFFFFYTFPTASFVVAFKQTFNNSCLNRLFAMLQFVPLPVGTKRKKSKIVN